MALSLATLAALLLDALLGEPRAYHPLAGFGRIAAAVEARLNQDRRIAGIAATGLLVLLPVLIFWGVIAVLPATAGWIVAALLAALCIAGRSLREHGLAVLQPLAAGDIAAARQRVGWLVSRETDRMDALAIRRATIESLLENASDGVFASLFWFAAGGLLAGPAGAGALVVMQRLANTLDAMWGYRTPRFARFGWAAARLDDALNWPAARITALCYALMGDTANALGCWRQQARAFDSPNAGPVMSAGAGALRLQLGGGGHYHGAWRARAILGNGAEPGDDDIHRTLGLLWRALIVWCVLIVLVDVW